MQVAPAPTPAPAPEPGTLSAGIELLSRHTRRVLPLVRLLSPPGQRLMHKEVIPFSAPSEFRGEPLIETLRNLDFLASDLARLVRRWCGPSADWSDLDGLLARALAEDAPSYADAPPLSVMTGPEMRAMARDLLALAVEDSPVMEGLGDLAELRLDLGGALLEIAQLPRVFSHPKASLRAFFEPPAWPLALKRAEAVLVTRLALEDTLPPPSS